MSLRRQLILVSLLLLSLPWAGCQFLREIESALREGQAKALGATAQAVAASLGAQAGLLYPDPDRLRETPEPERAIYAPLSNDPIIVDGYADGWPQGWSARFAHPGGHTAVSYRAAVRSGQLFLLLKVEDPLVVYDNPGLSPEPNGDRLLLRTWLDNRRQDYVIATAAPGAVRARHAGRRHPGADAQRIQGYWQDRPGGYTLELTLPLAMTGGRLGLQVINSDAGKKGAPATAGNIHFLELEAPPWLVYSPTPLREALAAFTRPGRALTVLDRAGRELASAGSSAGNDQSSKQAATFWLLRVLYRRALSEGELPPMPAAASDGRQHAPEAIAALENRAGSRWYRQVAGDRRTILSAAAPVTRDGVVIGAVLARQSNEEYLSLTDQAFSRLLGVSLLATAVATLGLLFWASLLSWRIGRLSRAAGKVIDNGSIVLEHFPRSRARDEVGELSRRYASLLTELQAYNDYLRTLSRKLSHELRTPMAVIQSSLDNLEQDSSSTGDSAVYVERAREGLARLNRILTAMTEASRVEDSVRGDTPEPLDLVPLLQQVLPAYRDAYPDYRFELDCPLRQAWTRGSADLLVQALDKLVDNAASFSPAGGPVTLGLAAESEQWHLWVENEGPPLPEELRPRLFDAMISLRDTRVADKPHLGLGLYIVRLIAEHLGGRPRAGNCGDGRRVRVGLTLPRIRASQPSVKPND